MVALMEPMLIAEGSRHRGDLIDLAVEVAAASAGFRRSDAAITIEKRMNPQEPVMRRGDRKYSFRFSQTAVGVLETGEESRRRTGAPVCLPSP
jgi:hypothetical protein